MAFNNSSTSRCDNGECQTNDLIEYSMIERTAIVASHMLIFLLAIPANGIVITVISRVQNVQTPTSTFLMNLCIADILIASLYIPFVTIDLYVAGSWIFGDFMCKLVSFLYFFATNFSILILTAISVERYVSVCRPRQMRLTAKKAFVTTLLLWFVAGFTALPLFIVRKAIFNPIVNVHFCVETWSFKYSKAYKAITLAMLYIIPLGFMAVVYYKIGKKVWASADKTKSMKLTTRHASNSKLRLTKIALAIILSFAVSWTPFNTMTLLFFFDRKNYPYSQEAMRVANPIVFFIAFSNCSLNPLLYCYMSQNFRKALHIFWKRKSRRNLRDSISIFSRTSTRRFSRRSKRRAEQSVIEPNGVAYARETLRTKSDNPDYSPTSPQPEMHNTVESILITSAV